MNYGKYKFFHASTLGGKTNLRGYRKMRFSGDACFYQNSEVKFKISDIRSIMINGPFGLLGFYDSGRVWFESENSEKWHNGYGGGLWLAPFKMTVFSVLYSTSQEEKMITINLSFGIKV